MAFDRRSSSFFVADGGSNSGGVWRMHWDSGHGDDRHRGADRALGDDRATGLDARPDRADRQRRPARQRGVPDHEGLDRGPADRGSAGRRRRAGDRRSCAGRRRHPPSPSSTAISTSRRTSSPTTTTPPSRRRSSRRTASAACRSTPAPPVAATPSRFPGSTAASRTRWRPIRSAAASTWGRPSATSSITSTSSRSTRAASRRTRRGSPTSRPWASRRTATCSSPTTPALGALVVDSFGMGRIWRVGLQTLDRPATGHHLRPRGHEQPHARYPSPRRGRVPSSSAGSTRHGLRRLPGRRAPGTVAYDALSEGVHAFDVRALDPAPGSTPGHTVRRTFIVDLTAPSVTYRLPSRRRAAPGRGDPAQVLGGRKRRRVQLQPRRRHPRARAARAGR